MALWTAAQRRVVGLIVGAMTVGVGQAAGTASFDGDLAFLRQHTSVVVLKSRSGEGQIIVAPAWQGRVMTSTAGGPHSFGWINRKLVASGEPLAHFNPFGGEDRVWLGPEGGQYSIYFGKGAPFDLDHWFVPKSLDALPFEVEQQTPSRVSLKSRFSLKNHSGTQFQVSIQRDVEVLEPGTAWRALGLAPVRRVPLVAYESRNTLTNAGTSAWRKETGLLSIWILGMFKPSNQATIIIPIRSGSESELGRVVTSDYFGTVPSDRLKVTDSAIFLRGDGRWRSKVGVSPRRSLGKLGSYDAVHHVLTIVQFDQPHGVTDYVNSLWKIQSNPYGGDAANAYNDGPPKPGAQPMGPFFELESSSPAAALTPSESMSHIHRTIHLVGAESDLDRVSQAVLGVSLAQIKVAFGGA